VVFFFVNKWSLCLSIVLCLLVHILEAIFDACEIEESDKMRNRLASIITNSSRIPWSTVQAQLIREGGLSEPKTEELRQFLHFKGEPNRLLSQLGSHFTNFGNRAPHVHQKAKRAISHLYKMLAALSEFGVDRFAGQANRHLFSSLTCLITVKSSCLIPHLA
jgi:histidyl-tRNA synthetase